MSATDRQPAEGGRQEVDEALQAQQHRQEERDEQGQQDTDTDEAGDPYQAEPDDHQCTEVLTDEDGEPYVVCQERVGEDRVVGGGEFPDPNAPARFPAPGAVTPSDS